MPENPEFYKFPIPKNKNINKFMSDCESIRSVDKK